MALCRTGSEGKICNLGDDLWMEILSKLPPKPLIICKCVSKKFRLLVSTLIHPPSRSRPMSGLYMVEADTTSFPFEHFENFVPISNEIDFRVDTSFLPCFNCANIIDFRDGFLLCSSGGAMDDLDGDLVYYVCNPVTRQWVVLPPPPETRLGMELSGAPCALIMDDDSPDLFFLHFKVIQFVTVSSKSKKKLDIKQNRFFIGSPLFFGMDAIEVPLKDLYVYVYSSQAGQWAESKASLKGIDFTPWGGQSAFLNGSLFLSLPDALNYVLMFDVKEEHCELLNLPADSASVESLSCTGNRLRLGASQGCLNYACHDGLKMQVWMMPDSSDTYEWVLKHSVNLDDIEFPNPFADYSGPMTEEVDEEEPMAILAFHPNLDAVFLRNRGDFCCYDFSNRALERIIHYSPSYVAYTSFWVCPFSICLCSLANAQQRIKR